MFRKLLLGVAAAAALGGVALTATPASAQYFGFGPAYGFGYRPAYFGDVPRSGVYYNRPSYGYGRVYYGRPYYSYGGPYWGPRCFVRPGRYWDGWSWAAAPRRICR
jgi:hypothetical protein